MPSEFFCGEALCKKPIRLPAGFAAWPFRCPACGTALYAADVLARTPVNELDPKRAALMTAHGGVRREVTSSDVGGVGGGGARAPVPDVDRLLAMVDLGDATPTKQRPAWIWAAITAAVVIGLAVVFALR